MQLQAMSTNHVYLTRGRETESHRQRGKMCVTILTKPRAAVIHEMPVARCGFDVILRIEYS